MLLALGTFAGVSLLFLDAVIAGIIRFVRSFGELEDRPLALGLAIIVAVRLRSAGRGAAAPA